MYLPFVNFYFQYFHKELFSLFLTLLPTLHKQSYAFLFSLYILPEMHLNYRNFLLYFYKYFIFILWLSLYLLSNYLIFFQLFFQMALHEVLDSVVGREYLMKFLDQVGSKYLLNYFNSVEELRQAKRCERHQLGTEIFYTYINTPSPEIKVDKVLIQMYGMVSASYIYVWWIFLHNFQSARWIWLVIVYWN